MYNAQAVKLGDSRSVALRISLTLFATLVVRKRRDKPDAIRMTRGYFWRIASRAASSTHSPRLGMKAFDRNAWARGAQHGALLHGVATTGLNTRSAGNRYSHL